MGKQTRLCLDAPARMALAAVGTAHISVIGGPHVFVLSLSKWTRHQNVTPEWPPPAIVLPPRRLFVHSASGLCLPDPEWASHTLRVFVCLSCSGVHRSMPQVSKVKSARLDAWEEAQVEPPEGAVDPGQVQVVAGVTHPEKQEPYSAALLALRACGRLTLLSRTTGCHGGARGQQHASPSCTWASDGVPITLVNASWPPERLRRHLALSHDQPSRQLPPLDTRLHLPMAACREQRNSSLSLCRVLGLGLPREPRGGRGRPSGGVRNVSCQSCQGLELPCEAQRCHRTISRGLSLEAWQGQRAVVKPEVRAEGTRGGPEVFQQERREPGQGSDLPSSRGSRGFDVQRCCGLSCPRAVSGSSALRSAGGCPSPGDTPAGRSMAASWGQAGLAMPGQNGQPSLAKDPKASMKIEHLNATFQPAHIGHPHGLQVTYLKDNSTRNIFVCHEDGKDSLVYLLNQEQHTVGQRTPSRKPSISLSAPDILPPPCTIHRLQPRGREHVGTRLVLEPMPGAPISIIFSELGGQPVELRHGDLLSLGLYDLLLFKDSAQAQPLPAQALAASRPHRSTAGCVALSSMPRAPTPPCRPSSLSSCTWSWGRSFTMAGLVPDPEHILLWMSTLVGLLYFIQQKCWLYMQSLEDDPDVTGTAGWAWCLLAITG
ncbi:hypothetical protein MC885_005711 [Smutsia gigantea]|nr:hypothetical protein MC885_005711 [Smutsia gigantea]